MVYKWQYWPLYVLPFVKIINKLAQPLNQKPLKALPGAPEIVQLRTDRPRGKFLLVCGFRVIALYNIAVSSSGVSAAIGEKELPDWLPVQTLRDHLEAARRNPRWS